MGTCCKAVLLNDSESTIDEAQLTGKESMAEGDEFEFGERFLVQMAKSYSPVATESVVMPQKRLSQLNVNASSSLQQPRRKKLNLGPKPRANECQNAHKTTQQPTAAYARPVMAERVCMQPSNVVLNNSHDDQPAFRVLEPKHMRSASDVLLLLQSPARPNAAHLNFHEDPFTSRQTKHANRPSAVPNHAKSDHGLGTITLDDLDGDDLCVQPDSTSAPPQSTFSVPDLASALHSKPAEKLQPRQKPRTPEKMHMLGGVRSVTCSRQQDHGNKQDHGNSALVSALPVEIAEEEEEDELLARMEARSKKAKGALRQTELGGMDHRQYREVNEPFSHTTAVHNQPAFQQQRNDGNQSNTIPDWNQPRLSSQPANNLPNNTHHNPVEVQFRPDMYASVGFSTLAQKVSAANQVKLGDTAHHTMQRKSRLVAPLKLKTNPRTIVFPNEAECTKPHAPAPEIPDLVGCGVKTYRCAFAAALYHELNHSVRHFAQRFHQVAADYHKTFGSAVGKQMVTFFRRKGIPIYSSFILDTGYDGPVRGGRKKDVPQKIYLKLENDTEKERSSDYTKGDLWFLERNNEKVVVRSLWHGMSQRGWIQVDRLHGSQVLGKQWSAIRMGGSGQFFADLVANLDSPQLDALPLLPLLLKSAAPNPAPVCACQRWMQVQEKMSVMKEQFQLNEDQAAVVTRVAESMWGSQPACTLVHGPFGTGKSTLVISASANHPLFEGISPGFLAMKVDRIMCGLLKHGFDDFTRIGSFKRITKKLLPHTVHHQMLSEEASKGNDAMQELQAMALDSAACASDLAAVKQAMESVRNGKMAERAAMLKQRPVVGITCASATPALLADQVFSIVIMDEASQLTEPASLQPIVQAGCRFLLAVGDPKQLPPVVSATEGTGIGTLSCPLFTRLAENYITPILLRRQYRCHPAISGLASRLFYEGRLLDGLSIEERSPVFEGLPTLCMIEADGTEQRVGSSYFNDGEARAIGKLCRVLVDNGMDQADIGVISLYTAQASKIAEMLAAGSAARVKSSTVDAFQGEEREVILLSTVRSHSNQHTSNRERMCVALTRAKRHLVVFGAGSKMASNGLWKIIVQSSRTVEHVNLLCSSVASSPCQLQKPMDDHILEEEPTSSNVILMHDELPTSIQMDDDDLWDDDDDE